MKELVILSGKGGTGKTSLTAAFATLAAGCMLCDADVDAADLHLLMHPDIKKRTDFLGGGVAVIDPQRCSGCGTCIDMCRWSPPSARTLLSMRSPAKVAGCAWISARRQAIDFPIKTCGQWFVSETVAAPWCMPGWALPRKIQESWWLWCVSRPDNWPRREALT